MSLIANNTCIERNRAVQPKEEKDCYDFRDEWQSIVLSGAFVRIK